jgi:hypothetical protein
MKKILHTWPSLEGSWTEEGRFASESACHYAFLKRAKHVVCNFKVFL